MMVLSGGSLAQFPASTCSRLVVRQAQRLRQRPRAPKKLQPQVLRRRSLLCRAYADGANTLDALDEADDFYSILGVSPRATQKEIKQAYKNLMRACHPDVAAASMSADDEDDGSADDVCVFINAAVMETLMDPDKRAAYDALMGFSSGAVNPFNDRSYERNKVFVSEYDCIGCKNCANMCPKTFDLEDDYGRSRAVRQGADPEEELEAAIQSCPVDCIHWVTDPQLALLETTMLKMERVQTWVLMMGGGSGVDVFLEASIAWEKRQAKMRAKREGERQKSWLQWGAAATASAYPGPTSQEARQQQETAAATAAAARKWREYQRSRSRSAIGHLPGRK